MPKPRNKENKGLPLRWRRIRDVYYYDVPQGLEPQWENKKLFRLGRTIQEASQVWIQRKTLNQESDEIRTIGQLLDRYALEVIPTKSKASQASNRNQLPMIRGVFGGMPLTPFKPLLVYQYVQNRSRKITDPSTGKVKGGKIAAHREIELLSHAFTKAVEWGVIDRHPFKGEVRLSGERPRNRYVEDWEINEALSLRSNRTSGSVLMIQAYLRLKLLTGMSQGDLLRLQESQLKEDGIHNQRHKTSNTTGKRTIYQWSPKLREAVALAKRSRPVDFSPFLFCNRDGVGYIDEQTGYASGWKSMWQRFMDRLIDETKVTERFTEHDLRAKVASDAETLEHARALLAHSDSRTTDRIYRRKAEVVVPLE
jgi:integrase